MQRPPSIVLFERLYLASFGAWLIAQAMTWEYRTRLLASNPMLAQPTLIMAIGVLTIAAVSAMIWYFAARRAAQPAKWAAVALAALSLIGLLFSAPGLMSSAGPSLPAKLIALIASVLNIAAAALLFRPDAKTWFGEEGFEDHERE